MVGKEVSPYSEEQTRYPEEEILLRTGSGGLGASPTFYETQMNHTVLSLNFLKFPSCFQNKSHFAQVSLCGLSSQRTNEPG